MNENNNFQSAVLGPDVIARQLKMQQQQQFAKQMTEESFKPLQGQMVSGRFVAPSWTQYLAQGVKAYMGKKAADDLPNQASGIAQAQQDGANRMFGLGQPSPQALGAGLGAQGDASAQPVSSPAQPGAQALAAGLQSSQAQGAGIQGAQAQGAPMPSSVGQPSAGQSQMPLLPGRSAQESAKAFMFMGPQEYMKQVATQGAPTDIQKNLIGQGIQPGSPQWNQALGDATFKSGYVPPTSAAPGATLIDPRTGRPTFSAPQNGVQTQYGPNGQATASQVPGFAQAQAGIAGAETAATEAAKAGLDLVNVPDGQGGTVQMPRSQAVQALGQGGAQPGAAGHTPPKQVLDARQDLPKVISQADSMISSIDGILSHPGLSSAVGLRVPGMTSMPGTEAANFQTRLDQLKGQAFLQAFQSLRGGGQITEVEGQKATDAIGRLNNNQSETEFKKSMDELRGILQSAKQRAYGMAQVPNEAPKQASADTAKPDRNALMQEARRRGLIK